jgi:hypothetical protein
MRSDFVVLTPELLDRDLRIDSVSEPLHRKTFIAEFAIEGLVGAVLPRLPGIDMDNVDVRLREPLQYRSRHKLRAIVRPQMLGTAVNVHHFAEHFDHATGANDDGQADACQARRDQAAVASASSRTNA